MPCIQIFGNIYKPFEMNWESLGIGKNRWAFSVLIRLNL